MKKTLGTLLFAAIFLGASQAHALAVPQKSPQDGRIQRVVYSPNNVTKITAKVGHAVLIQFENDERLAGDSATLGMGDAEGWKLSVKGNNIIFKPQVEQSDTNLIVTTNKRTYVFQLSINENAKYPTYILRFDYPDTKLAEREREIAERRQVLDIVLQRDRKEIKRQNTDYWGFGDAEIAPTSLFDDGRFTYFDFDNGKELPAIYKRMPDGTESLVNVHVDGTFVVVQELSKDFVLRLGESVLGIDNRGFDVNGTFNRFGTSETDKVRIVK